MFDAKTLHAQMEQDDPEYAREYDALEQEFMFIKKMILVRRRAGMSQPRLLGVWASARRAWPKS